MVFIWNDIDDDVRAATAHLSCRSRRIEFADPEFTGGEESVSNYGIPRFDAVCKATLKSGEDRVYGVGACP